MGGATSPRGRSFPGRAAFPVLPAPAVGGGQWQPPLPSGPIPRLPQGAKFGQQQGPDSGQLPLPPGQPVYGPQQVPRRGSRLGYLRDRPPTGHSSRRGSMSGRSRGPTRDSLRYLRDSLATGHRRYPARGSSRGYLRDHPRTGRTRSPVRDTPICLRGRRRPSVCSSEAPFQSLYPSKFWWPWADRPRP